MKKINRTFRGILLLIALIVTLLFCVTISTASTCSERVEIGNYLGIPAYSNGAQTGTGSGCWQCVDYVKRFYAPLWNTKFSGNAGTYYNSANSWGLRRYPKDSPFSPWPKDILVYSGGPYPYYGHVSIIKGVSSNSIQVIEQNVNRSTAYRTISKNGNTISTMSGYTVLGWVRVPLMRVTGTSNVYYIDANYKKALIPTANVFNSYGWKWNGINDVSQADFDKYSLATPSKVVFKDGTFLKKSGSSEISLIRGGQRHPFASWDAYLRYGGASDLSNVMTVTPEEYTLNALGSTYY